MLGWECSCICVTVKLVSSEDTTVKISILKTQPSFQMGCTVRIRPMPEFTDQVLAKTSPKRSFSFSEIERFLACFRKNWFYKSGHCSVPFSSLILYPRRKISRHFTFCTASPHNGNFLTQIMTESSIISKAV
jgi:hypothetical protein